MDTSVTLYLALLASVAIGRGFELRRSRRNQQCLLQEGASKAAEPSYSRMVAFHAAVLAGSVLEVVLFRRPLILWLAIPALALFLASNALRWWAIRSLGARWNVQVMSVSALGVAVGGPYRWVRHPNYAAVYLEMLALPLIHTAWIVALAGAVLHVAILRDRVALEESVMMRDAAYRSAFANKPRFLPVPASGGNPRSDERGYNPKA